MRKIILGIFSIALLSCGKKIETVVTEVTALSASRIYSQDSVSAYLAKYGASNDSIAVSYLSRASAEDAQVDKAIYCVKRAITLHPKYDSYLQLAQLLERAAKYEELNDLYNFLTNTTYDPQTTVYTYVFGKPDERVFYELLVSSFLYQKRIYSYSIYKAENAGVKKEYLKNEIINDPRVTMDKKSEEWQNLMLLFLSQEEIDEYLQKVNVFNYLQKSIMDSTPVFTIDENSVQEFKYDYMAELEYSMMEGNSLYELYDNYILERKQTPPRWYNYNFCRKLSVNDSISAIVYSIDTSAAACPRNMRHIYYRLVTFDNYGNNIDDKVVATQAGELLQLLSFVQTQFTITEYKRQWEKKYDYADLDNFLVKTEFVGKKSYSIMPDGKILEE